jgi:hypothetical protein
MPRLFILFIAIAGFISISSCSQDEVTKTSDDSYLVFGRFYGECLGEQCVEIFKLEHERLFEDTNDIYPGNDNFYTGNFVELGNDKYQLVKDLRNHIPKKLLEEIQVVYGCPDCADQGGLYIEYKSDAIHKYWILDQSKTNVPEYLHAFMDLVNGKIEIINE